MAEIAGAPELTQKARPREKKKRRKAGAGALGRSRSPRRLRVTREGWIFILVTVGVGAAAVNTGNNLLFLVLGLMLSLIVISGVMSESTLRRIKVERHVPTNIHAQTQSLIEVTLRNKKKRLPSYSVELEDLLEGWSTDKRCYFLKVAPRGKQTAAYKTVIPKRGPLQFTGYRVATRFPFALFEKWREIELAGEVIVFPALVTVPRATGLQRYHEGELGQARPGQGDEIHGLRDLRPGDDYRAIHWRTSARQGRLMIREFEEEESRTLCIYLDNARSEETDDGEVDEVVEEAISVAASLAVERTAKGQGVQIAVRGDRAPRVEPGGSAKPLLHFLAKLEYAPAVDPPPFGHLPRGEAILIAEKTRTAGFEGAVIGLEKAGVSP